MWRWIITVIFILLLMMETGCKETNENFYRPQSPTPTHADTLGCAHFNALHRKSQTSLNCVCFAHFDSLKRLLASPSLFSFHLSSPLSHSSVSQVNPCCFTLLAWFSFSSFSFPFFILLHTFYGLPLHPPMHLCTYILS